jgi:hypothetical protein
MLPLRITYTFRSAFQFFLVRNENLFILVSLREVINLYEAGWDLNQGIT